MRAATGVSHVPWMLHTVTNGFIQFRFHVIGWTASVACARHLAQAPSSSGQRGLQLRGSIASRSERDRRVALERASKLTELPPMANQWGTRVSPAGRAPSRLNSVVKLRP